MKLTNEKSRARIRRSARVRKKVAGTAARPRLRIFRSLKHTYVQFVDDDRGRTLGAVSTRSGAFREAYAGSTGTVEAARALGEMAGEMAASLGITQVVFDRSGYRYHGRVKAVADGARSRNLKF